MRKVLVLLIIIFLSGFKHPFYLGVVDLKFNANEKALQGSVKLFINDFEASLKKLHKKSIDLINVKDKEATTKIVSDYLRERLKIKVNDKALNYKLIGFENEAEAIWMYIEFEKSEVPKKVEIENTLLYEHLKDQINIIHVEINNLKKSLKATNPEKNLKFAF